MSSSLSQLYFEEKKIKRYMYLILLYYNIATNDSPALPIRTLKFIQKMRFANNIKTFKPKLQ